MAQRFSALLGIPLIGAVIYFASTHLHTMPLWGVAICVLLVALPTMFAGIYCGTLRRVHENKLLRPDGWLFRIRSGRTFLVAGWTIWGVFSAFVLLLQLNLYTAQEWWLFCSSVPLFLGTYYISQAILSKHVRFPHDLRIALSWTRWLMPALMVLVYGIVLWNGTIDTQIDTLHNKIELHRQHLYKDSGSAIVDELLQIFSAIAGAKDFAEAKLGTLSKLVVQGISLSGAWVAAFTACGLISFLMIPRIEFRRVFGPMSDDETPKAPTLGQVLITVAISTFLLLFLYLHGLVLIERLIIQNDNWTKSRKEIEATLVVFVDQIDGKYFSKGTIAAVDKLRNETLSNSGAITQGLRCRVERAFASMEGNVDGYLDWYYSLPAEYVRIGMTLTGKIEDHVSAKLQEHLEQSDSFKSLSTDLNQAVKQRQELVAGFNLRRDQILQRNELNPGADKVIKIVQSTTKRGISFDINAPHIANPSQRAAGSVAAGTLSAAIAAKVVTKVIGSATFKAAVTAVAKIGAGKVASVAGSAALGAGLGSFFPGVGTIFGAVSGAVVGAFMTVATDAALLKLDEHVRRDAFRNEIVQQISSAKNELLKELGLDKVKCQ